VTVNLEFLGLALTAQSLGSSGVDEPESSRLEERNKVGAALRGAADSAERLDSIGALGFANMQARSSLIGTGFARGNGCSDEGLGL
jgi:hypothetical protein